MKSSLPPAQNGLVVVSWPTGGGKHRAIFIGEQHIDITGEAIPKFVQLICCGIIQHILDEWITVSSSLPGQITLAEFIPDLGKVFGGISRVSCKDMVLNLIA